MSVNKVILVGNVGKNPEIRYVDSRPYATFSLATTERAFTTAQGVQVPERTEWHNVVMWDRNAISRTVTEIVVENFDILSRAVQQS